MRKIDEKTAQNLIESIKKSKEKGCSLTSVFKEFSIKNDLAIGSVRNYYYKTLKNSKKDFKLKKLLKISDEMYPEFIKEFSNSEEKELLKKVLIDITNGNSVRKSIVKISNGKEKLVLRNQNKYRNILKNKPNLVEEVMNEIILERGFCKNPYKELVSLDLLKELEKSVNELINKTFIKVSEENKVLKETLKETQMRNQKLTEILKHYVKEKKFTKDFFAKGETDISV